MRPSRHFLAELMNITERAPRYLNDDQIANLNFAGNRALTAYGILAADCLRDGLGYFQLRPKVHATCTK